MKIALQIEQGNARVLLGDAKLFWQHPQTIVVDLNLDAYLAVAHLE